LGTTGIVYTNYTSILVENRVGSCVIRIMPTFAIDYMGMNDQAGTLVTAARDRDQAFELFREALQARGLITASLLGSARLATSGDYAKAAACAARLVPFVGMGVTYYCGSDRYAYTVIEVLSSTKLVIQQDSATLVSQDQPQGEDQAYRYARNPQGEVPDISLRGDGSWRQVGRHWVRGSYFKLGERRYYKDPSFWKVFRMSKVNLRADTVLRRNPEDGGKPYLMNRQEGGWCQIAIPIGSEEELLAGYHVRLGEWSRDEYGEFCPVICIPRSEQPTLHDGEEEETLTFQPEEENRARALGRVLYEQGALEGEVLSAITPGLQQFIDTHPGVRVGNGPEGLVALMPDGTVYALDEDGTVLSEDVEEELGLQDSGTLGWETPVWCVIGIMAQNTKYQYPHFPVPF
jgi:hypothetical protein